MKNLFKFNFKSIVRNKARWLITLIAIFIIGVGQMWADNAGINSSEGANINILIDGVERKEMKVSYSSGDYNGPSISCSSLIIEDAYLRTWKKKTSGNVCQAKFWYAVYTTGGSQVHAWTEYALSNNNSWQYDDGDETKQQWQNTSLNIDVAEGLEDGEYNLVFNFQAKVNVSNSGDCGNWHNYNKNNNNYYITFTVKRNTCTVESDISNNVFLFDALSGMNIYAWKDGGRGNGDWPGVSIYSGGPSSTNLFDRIGNYFIYNIKNGAIVNSDYNDEYQKFIIVNGSKESEKTGDLVISDRVGKFYKYTDWTISESQAYECPVKVTRSHYGPIWGDALTMTFKLKNWTNLEGGTYEISSPDGATIISGASGSITSSEGEAKCAIQLPAGDTRADGNVEIDFDYTVNHVTFKVKAYIHVFQPIVLKVYDEVGFKNIYLKETTKNAEDWHTWPGAIQESLGNNWYLIRLNPHLYKFWLNNGSYDKQTYSEGMSVSDFATGQVRALKLGTDPNNTPYQKCWLGDAGEIGVALYRMKTYDGTNTYYSNAVAADATGDDAILSFYADLYNGSATYQLQSMAADATTWSDGALIDKTVFTSVYDGATAAKPGNIFVAKLNSSTPTGITDVAVYDRDLGFKIHCGASTSNYLYHGNDKSGTGTKFIYFEPNATIFPGELFNYYWVDWFPENETVVASVGNAYNNNLAHIIGIDAYAPDGVAIRTGEESKFHGGNFRFGYQPETNYFSRSVVGGSGGLIKIKGTRVKPASVEYGEEATFSDATSWVYTVNADVKGKATATITTAYNYVDAKLATNQQLIGGDINDNTTEYNVLITYDFKTNRLLAAWNPSGDFEGFNLESNLMVVRRENGNPTVLNIVDEDDDDVVTPLSKIAKIYTVMEFLQDNWKSEVEPYSSRPYAKRRIESPGFVDEYYWISLPYECLVKDIFGIEGYGSRDYDSWVLQTYRGDLRAQTGWWAETDAWWYDMDRTDTLKANEGYVLRVTNLNGEGYGTKRFAGESGGKLYLYFPSEANDTTIGPLTGPVTTTLDSLKCTKWHKRSKEVDPTEGENNPIYDRRAIDSNWRIIGSPSFNSTTISKPTFLSTAVDADRNGWIDKDELAAAVTAAGNGAYSLKYFYDWEVEYKGIGEYETKFTVADASTTEFIGTHAHLVQYAGDITWVAYDEYNPLVGLVPNAAPARRNEDEGESFEQTLRLVLKQGANEADVTYISRMLFGATTGYDINMDLSKMTNANSANIYTYGDLYKMAGNCLPDSVTTIQVGVQLATAGDYTFSLPDGTYGTGVVLVDNVANTRTNLALTDYTVTLQEGETNERFYLELSPIAQNPTGIEAVSDQNAAVRKVMVDGILYIVKDGVIYDARGNRVQ